MLAVYTPYGRNEVTAAALRLAEAALEAGLDVRLVATGPHEPGVHPFWDSRVWSARNRAAATLADGVDQAVWFCCHPPLLDLLAATVRRRRAVSNTLVPSGHSLCRGDAVTLRRFDRIVAPSRRCYRQIRDGVFGGRPPPEMLFTWSRWDSGLPHTPHDGPVGTLGRRLLLHCDSASVDECPGVVLHLVGRLLAAHADAALTVLHARSWCRKDRARIRDLVSRHGHRLTFLPQRDFQDQAALFQQHDWLLLPGVRSDFGLTAVRGLSCGLPVICHDVEPFSEQVRDGVNGALVPCEVVEDWLGMPSALANAGNFEARCRDALLDPEVLYEFQGRDWQLGQCRKSFMSFWLNLFGL